MLLILSFLFSHPFSYLPGDTQGNIYKDHWYLKNVQVKALYIWNQGLFTQTTDELGGQTFSGFQEHPFEAATCKRHYFILYLISLNQAMLRLVFCFFFLIKRKKNYYALEHLDSFYAELLNITLTHGKLMLTLLILYKASTSSK